MTQALYRKYRPLGWDAVRGQEHIVETLQSSIKLGNVAHAYLFFGSRGTGKTTVARIVARELGTSDNDIFEMDAASNRGIDDIRELRENISTLPFDSKYKVYIIDEAHMLTKEAWNAMLKTLEEPPAHVVFILATTELEKVPETIVSRCQVYTFKKPTMATLRDLAIDTAKSEGFTLEPAGADLVALLGDGSFRDMYGMLQKAIAGSADKKISLKEIERVSGAPSGELVRTFLSAFVEHDAEVGVATLTQAAEQNIEMPVFLKLVLVRLRAALLMRYAPRAGAEVATALSEADQEFLATLVKKKAPGLTSAALVKLLEAGEIQKHASVPTLPLELALVSLIEK